MSVGDVGIVTEGTLGRGVGRGVGGLCFYD